MLFGIKRPRLTVRVMMLVVLVLAVWLGWQVNKARRQREAVAAIKEYGGFVYYDWQMVNGKFTRGRKPNAPDWLRSVIGDEFFQDVTRVNLVVGTDRAGKRQEVQRKTDDVIPYLAAFPELNGLSLQGTQATDRAMEVVGTLTKLESLLASDTHVTDAGMAKLTGLTRLNALEMDNLDTESNPGRLTDATLTYLEALPHLETLNLQGNRFSDRGLSHVTDMTNLRVLLLSNLVGGSDITDSGLVHLKKLKKLELLGIQGSKVTDAGLASLTGLSGLQELWIKGMGRSVSDEAIKRLQADLPNLKSVR